MVREYRFYALTINEVERVAKLLSSVCGAEKNRLAHNRFNNNENIISQTERIDRTPSKGGDLKAHYRRKLRKMERVVEPGKGEEEGEKV